MRPKIIRAIDLRDTTYFRFSGFGLSQRSSLTDRYSYCLATTTIIKLPGLTLGRPLDSGWDSSNSAVGK